MTDIDLRRLIRTIPNHPKPGIQFRDITTLLSHPTGFLQAVRDLARPFRTDRIDAVVGIEARGFILGGAVAAELGAGFVPVRKHGRLPGEVFGQDYELEYGTDRIEIHADALSQVSRVLVVDDLIATGGTALAALDLVARSGAAMVAAAFVIGLPDLGGVERLQARGLHVHTLVAFDGH